jgi:HAD superfamily hydrolase (TIGR01509 family)
MARLEAAVFDLDGLMIDSEPLQWRATNLALRPLGIQIDEQQWMRMVGRRTIDNLERLRETYGLEADLQEVERVKDEAYRRLIKQDVRPMPGLHAAMDVCRRAGLDLALASCSVRADVEIVLNSLGLNGSFRVVVTGADVSIGKPDPQIFLETARRLRVDPCECVALEDTAYGVAAAKTAGMLCIAVPNRFTVDQDFDLADVVLHSLTELDLDTLNGLQDDIHG